MFFVVTAVVEELPRRRLQRAAAPVCQRWRLGGGAFERSLTFRVIAEKCMLIGFDEDYIHRGSDRTTSTSINFLTRVREVTHDSIDGKAPMTVRRTSMPLRPLLTMEQVGDGMEFQPT